MECKEGMLLFLIIKDEEGFICSYKNLFTGELATIFKGDMEFKGTLEAIAPTAFYFKYLSEAKEACKIKYKELLIR